MIQAALFLILIFVAPTLSFAQNLAGSTKLINPLDQSLALQRIVAVPAVDNVDGLYANPLHDRLQKLIDEDPQFNLIDNKGVGSLAPEDLQAKPNQALSILGSKESHALMSLRIERGIKGTTLILGLSSLPEGKILLLEKTLPLPEASIDGLKEELASLYKNLKSKLPYDGLVMSRRAANITINLGSNQGMKVGQEVDLVQIMDIERHPNFDFMISTTNTILGTAEITKVDDNLSFARIKKERSPGVIEVGAKVDVRNFVEYKKPIDKTGPALTDLADSQVAFGEQPEEWVPVEAPTFGSVLLFLGVGSYTQNIKISSTADSSAADALVDGAQSAKTSLAPSLALEGEVWLTPTWSLLAYLDQSSFQVENPYSDGDPSDLNVNLSQQGLMVGYNFLLAENFFGPKLQLLGGIGTFKSEVDSSDPLVFSSSTYSGNLLGITGLRLGINGEMDVPSLYGLRLGASFIFTPSPKATFDPSVNGTSANTVNHFRFYGSYRMGERFRIYSGLDMQSYVTRFSGTKRRSDENEVDSASQSMTRLMIGGQFLF